MLTLRTLTLSLLLTIIVASVGSGFLLDKLYAKLYLSEQTNEGLTQSQLEAIGTQLSGVLSKLDNKEEFIRVWQEGNAFLSLEIINRDDVGMPEELLQELKSTGYITLSSATNISYYFPYDENNYFVLRAPSVHQSVKSNWLPILFTVIFYALLMLIVFAWLIPLIRRLKTMQLSAKKLGEGDLRARITPSVVSHIKDIELEFNRMAQRIEDLVSDISLLSSAISHELRAPLAKLQFGLDALREQGDSEKRRHYEDRLEKVINDMTHLVETLLTYARLDKNIAQLPKDEVDLLGICTRLAASATQESNNLLASKNTPLNISINASQPFYLVNGDVFYLNLIIENLLSNAAKYGDGKILIMLGQKENEVLFSIEDNGPGIDENFKQDIFKPFIRGDNPNGKNEEQRAPQKGYGLGMALVKRIADLHNVEIAITKSEVLGGAKLTLTFAQIHCRG